MVNTICFLRKFDNVDLLRRNKKTQLLIACKSCVLEVDIMRDLVGWIS